MSSMQLVYIKEHKDEFVKNIFSSAQSAFDQIVIYRMVEDLLGVAGFKLPPVADEVLSEDPDVFEKFKHEALQAWTLAAAPKVEYYSTSEVADMVGVSQKTISRWVARGQFKGVMREVTGQHIEIPSTSVLTMPNGTEVLVGKLAAKYQEYLRRAEEESQEDELTSLERQLNGFEEKYGTIQELTARLNAGEIIDFGGLDVDVWSYLLKRKEELVGRVLVRD
ncbi:helix-turn-helix domain-containing protein [Paenibacillus aurantiacus]|uniref:Helix-turn-helix domain-containing protein n=1 Tax=Paenibacillus aurantiacus TaxID=1936118 RepID=A0ABV5L1N2_9BACL